MKSIFVWTHHDLDGIACCLALKWIHKDCEFSYQSSTGFNFREDFTKWLIKNRLSDYDVVYITDLDVSDNLDLVDKENVYIIDHHSSHVENEDYSLAQKYIVEYSSAAKLIYKLFRKTNNIEFDIYQKAFITLADDYDSYNLQAPDSTVLNSVFWNTQNNFETFMDIYKDGFKGFTPQQINMYNIHIKDLNKLLIELKYFENKALKIGKNKYHILATFASKSINEVADHMFEYYKPDIAIIVNLKSNHVSFRRGDKVDLNVGKLAELIADGGGHAYAAGGTVTPEFQAFTKLLKARKKMRRV